ncbi:hypothetical protein GCM10010172_76110 [Paractinoplanes ferrugineus]|uniref:Uncharacterized protein n=1 Tax=Paractinoplanes ferrugineus TaxID=113564 RepID=A0A919J009_9ACTN|nr:hypothetical protein [Actinoplanes ferrugineus]GIE11234.1 hypothetical protein Afe05nite_30740 [Actinoplanes ferrugineus]
MDGSASSDLDTPAPGSHPESAGGLPNISDYWPDAPHRMGPAADWYPDGTEPAEPASPPYPPEPQPTLLISPPPRPARRGLRLLLAVLAAVVFLGGSVLVLARMVLRDGPPAQPGVTAAPVPEQPDGALPADQNPPVSVEPAPVPTVSTGPSAPSAPSTPSAPPPTSPAPAAALPFTSGTFELTDDVVELNVTSADLGTDTVRFSTPAGSGLRPRLTIGGSTAKLDPNAAAGKGSGRLDVKLNSRVTWAIRMTGGVTTANYDLAGARLRRVDLGGGAARITMDLGKFGGTLPIKMSGGVNTWQITTAEPVPVTVLLRAGGGKVVLDGRTTNGIDKGTRLTGGKGAGGPALDIDAVAGLGTLTVAAD